jgi:serine phosphatase RsbU (regulator of sigma subunit)
MPLGTMADFPYDVRETELYTGDTILLMTDGFPELLNNSNEQFGYKRARNLFEETAEKSPEDIIDRLKNEGSRWVDDKDPDDDVTFVVLKVK